MKSNLLKSIFISLILVMGVSNAWAASEGSSWYDWASSENVYFDNTNSSYSNVSMLIGRQWNYSSDGVGSSGVNFTKVANTNNLYHAATKWDHYNTLLFMDATGWGWEGNKVTQRYTYASNYTNTNNVNINGTELFYAASNAKEATLNHEDLSGYEALNSQQTIQSVVNGVVANSKATISITSYKMTAHNTTTKQTATLGTGANVSYITAARTATTTLTVGTVEAGYQFDGWYTAATGGTQLSTSTTYTYYPTAATTVYARFSEKKYTVTIKNDGHGTTNPTGAQSNVGQVTGLSIKATPAANYEFVNWTITSGSGSFGSTTSASTTFKPTSDATIQANFRSTATNSLTVAAGAGIASVAGSTDPVTLGNTYDIKATPKTGYTFSTWTANPAANASFGSATTANTTMTVKNGSVTVTATATENMSTLTTSNSYTEGNPGYAAPTASVNSIGYETTATVTATAAGNGYTFTGWTLTNCTRTDGGAADTTYITVRSNGDSKAATVVANYAEDLATTKWYISGNGNGSGNDLTPGSPFTGWATNGIQMFKKSGYSTEEIYYCTITANTVASSDDHFPFKVYNATTSEYWGNSGYWVTKENNRPTLSSENSGDNMKFRPYLVGTYEFKLDATNASSPVLTVTWPVYNQLRISAANPADATNTGEFDMTGSGTYTVTRSLKANTAYTFKIVYNSEWYGASSGNLTRASSSKTLSTSSNNLTLKTDIAGNYTFTFNGSNKQLTVTYPTAYKITYGVGTNKGTDAVTTSPSITSGELIDPSISITFSKGDTEAGYTWKNWNNKADGTGTELGTGDTYVSSNRTEDISVYACYDLITYDITYNLNGGTNPNDAPTSYNITTNDITLPTTPTKTGYTFSGWYDNEGCTGEPITTILQGSTDDKEFWAKWTANTYTVKFNANGGSGSMADQTFTYNEEEKALTANTFTQSRYDFVGWNTLANGTGTPYTDSQKVQNLTDEANGTITLYAQWQGAEYTVTLDQTGAAKEGSTTSVDANFEGNMPAITGDGVLPTPQNGYAFMGYWDKKDGQGTQYYNADGTSANVWDKAEDATLYAYFKKAEITTINLDKTTFEPVEAGGTGFVTATPIIEPTPTGNTIICWRLLYSNGSEVEGRTATQVERNTIKFSIAGLASGNYKIEAVLRTGKSCEGGTELSTQTANFIIASNYTITVKYTCDGKEIQAASKVLAHVTEETEITAPNITGYTFSSWEAGDGVTIESTNNDKVKITAIYDGYLTAKYTARPMVYFKNTLGWEKVYVYTFWDNAWWNDGTGVHPNANKLEQGEMKLVEGTDDIYYFELTNTDGDYTQENNANNNYIAFSSVNYIDDNDYFKEGQAVYRGDHKNNLTLFIPQADKEPEKPTNTQTQYYNKGIWMKYNSTESGYQLAGTVPNDDPEHDGWGTHGNKFTAQTPGGYTFSITKDLDANKTYEFKIKNYVYVNDWEGNAKNQWFATASQINTNACTSLPLDHEESAATRYGNIQITTTAAGEYIFTIDLSTGKVLLSVEYPVAVGDYRVIYKDNATWSQGTAHDANWYHPSRIIKENKTNETTKDIISFFISHGNNPTMKFQKVTSITNGNVTWEDAGAAKIPDNITTPGVYNFVIIQEPNGTSISMEEQAEPYTGNYYIRVDALAGKWDNYKTHSENRMTYSAFSESEANSFGEKFSHYATKYCTNGTNIKFTIANDYSPCISDTLAQDITNPLDNLDSEGTLLNNDIYSANVRFMWHHKTNKISRAYVGPAADKQSQFLMLRTKDEIQGAEGELDPDEGDIVDAEKEVYAARFADTQNWIYERTIKVKPGTRVKLYASYPKVYHIYVQNKSNWDQVALYAWKDSNHPLGDWPGTQPFGTVEIGGKTYYDFHVNEYVFGCQLILNNNDQGQQTDGDNAFKLATAAGNYYLIENSKTLTTEKSEVFATEATAQYFRGAYDNNNATWDDNNSIVILGGSGTDWNTIRVIYDFKTNRLMAALVPDQEVSEEKIIAADVMIIRKHQENATCITLTNDNSKLTEVKTVYGSLQFNRWVLNNRDSEKSGIEYCTKKIDNQDTYDEEVTNTHHPILSTQGQKTIYERALYFISFPFDVHLSDVFGFGTYGTHWVISTYNGQRRAQNGYFVDNCMNEDCTNWDYIWDPSDFTMKANQGYLLSLDLDLMKYDNTDFWLHNIDQVELFFPSTADLKTIEKTNYQMPALTEDYECTINFNKVGPEDPTYNPVNDHRVRDSYWRCIGVPSFANYDGSLYKTEQDAENEENPINWKTNYTWQADNAAFPFLYEWNVTDNSLQVQNTSNFNFKATFAYLVQNGNSIYWSAVNAKPSNIVARNQEAKRNYDWKITIARNGEVEDQTFVRLTDHEKVTTEFDFNQDLSKEFNYGRSDIYTLIGYEKAAANSLPLSEQTTLIPLGLSIEYNGDYTIAMPDGTANIGVTLIDTESNTRTNLSAGMEYTLTLKKGDYNNRFFIEISPIQQTPTDIEYVENSHDDQARKVLIDNILYIVRDGQIFDARGARLK